MTIFIDERLESHIEAGATARPRYSTDEITTDGGYVITNSRWRYPLHQFEFNLSPGYRDDDEALEQLEAIFHACGGAAGRFRFHYWRDTPVVGQSLGTGDGSTRSFQIFRTYTRGAFSRDRKITRPVEGTVVAYKNGVATGAIAVDYSAGVVTFDVAPALGVALTVDFEHDVPVKFADDELEMIGLTDKLDQPVNIVLHEVREPGLEV